MIRIAKVAARGFAVLFLLLALLTQISNPLIGPTATVHANRGLAMVYVGFAAILLLSSLGGESTAASALYNVAALSILLALVGYWQTDQWGKAELFDFVSVNSSSNILHGVLGIALGIAGKMNTGRYQLLKE